MAEPQPGDVSDPSKVPFTGIPGVTPPTSSVLRSIGPQQFPQGQQDPTPDEMQRRIAMKQLRLLDQLPSAMEADRAAKIKAAQAQAGQGYALDAANRKAASTPLPPTYKPNYKDQPNPPRFHAEDPANAIVQPLALIAALGGLFARRAGTATIRAMTGAMDGLREGNQRKYENYLKEFDEQLKATQSYNNLEHTKYTEAWDNRSKTLNERMALLQMMSTQYGNKAMATALQSGNAEMIQAQLQALEGASKVIANMQKQHVGGHAMDTQQSQAIDEGLKNGTFKTRDEAIRAVTGRQSVEDRERLLDKKHTLTAAEKEAEWDNRFKMAEKRGADAKELNEMRIKANQEIAEQRHKDRMDEIHERLKSQGLIGGTARKMDADTAARATELMEKFKKEHPDWTQQAIETQAVIQATRDHKEMEGKTGMGTFTPAMQFQIDKGWGNEALTKLKDMNFRMLAPERRRLENSADTMVYAEKVADFVRQNPRSMGILANMMNTLRVEQLVQGKLRSAPTYGTDTPEDAASARAIAQGAVAQLEGGVLKMVGQPVGRSGQILDQSDATNAVTLFKLLTQLALSDAAALSTNGQGGTVYLDRRFTDVYSQATSPEAMLLLIANRQEDVNVLWKEKLDLDWHKRKDGTQRPFFDKSASDDAGVMRANPFYMEGVRFNLYSDKQGPALANAIAKDKAMTPEVKEALRLRDALPTVPAIRQYLEAHPDQLTKEAVRILLQNVHGVR